MEESNIQCTVLFFAAAAEATGERELQLSLPFGSTVADAFEELVRSCSSLQKLQQSCALAVDEKIVPMDTSLTDGCTIAILPPVSGG
ncbi:MAG: molybdopterin converting factor subunit 1 [Phycisphaerales bacterium]|nr:molybdopterin converting factor subunit 1 [Phycisphaerales bacterium]